MLSLFALVAVTSCSTKEPATAIVRLTHDDPSKPVTIEDGNTFIHELIAYDSIDQANHQLELSKLWGLSDDQTDEKIRRSLEIIPKNGPEIYLVKCTGLKHKTGIQIINKLFTIYPDQQLDITPPAPKVNMSTIQAAK